MRIKGPTRIVGIIGHPIDHSLSPVMHNAAFEAMKLDYVYVPFHVLPESIAAAVGGLKVLGVRGVNVTIPYKEAVIPFVNVLSREAEAIGAVNTLVFNGDELAGSNTDGRGFIRAMRETLKIRPKGRNFVVIGAGGAGRAVAIQLALDGAARVVVLNRTAKRASELACEIKRLVPRCHAPAMDLSPPAVAYAMGAGQVIINATSVGMGDGKSPLSASYLQARHVVCDLVYRPAVTSLLAMAKKKGCRTMDGLGMLVHQGAMSFELWTGKKAPIDVMKRALARAIKDG